jgi:hypothetical protein
LLMRDFGLMMLLRLLWLALSDNQPTDCLMVKGTCFE